MTRRSTARRPRLLSVLAAVVACSTIAVLATVAPASATSFSNPAGITTVLPATCTSPVQASMLYPSNIMVSGLTGTIADVNVTLRGMNDFEGDFEVLLVGPAGGSQNLVLLSDSGSVDVSNFTLTLDDAAASALPQNGSWGSSPRTAKPTDYAEITGMGDSFPSPAPSPTNRPAPTGSSTLASIFNGANPNGTWSLYVVTDVCDAPAETITAGWTLDITTGGGTATSTSVSSSANPSTTGSPVTFTATVASSGSPVTAGTVTFTEGATTLAAGVALNASGQAAFSTSTLPEGNHIVTATYSGTATFATSNGSINQRVNNATVVTGSTYCNTGPIVVNARPNPATPYPSNIAVSGFPTAVGKVTVTLKNITHLFAEDIDVLLVGPGGQSLVVLSDASGSPPASHPTSNVTVTLDDAAAALAPAAGPLGAVGSVVTYRPTNYTPLGEVDVFPAPTPTPSAATTLATFIGAVANGTWSLYVVSDGAPDTGNIAGGWCIALTPAKADPTISTTASAGVTVGGQVHDTAVLAGGSSPTGSILFKLYGPDDPVCSGPVAFTTSTTVTGNASYDSPNFTTLRAGTYRWTTAYSGDTANNAATGACNAANESVLVAKASPTIATTASAGGPLGTVVTDAATVSGGSTPTGTVTFKLFGDNTCTTSVFSPAATTVVAGSATSAGFTPSAPGTYFWTAVYNGDANNNPTSSLCGAANESVTIAKANPTLSTTASAGGPLGTAVTDTATVSGGFSPTGTVTFKLFSDNTCAASVFTPAAANLVAGSATSSGFAPTSPGTYYWTAVYNGDVNNNAASSPCGAIGESVTIGKAVPTIATNASPGGPVGTAVSDTATVSGGASPGGDVTFRLFSDSACTTQVFVRANVALAGGSASSGLLTPAAPGTYYWTAVYNGDVNNSTAVSGCGAPNESVIITRATPTLSTSASAGGPVGTGVSDFAIVAGGFSPTGTVTFRLFSDSTCTATAVFTSPPVAVSAGTALSGPFTPTSPGTYLWTAFYSGDINNTAVNSPCNAPNESVTISKASPTISTVASAPGPLGTAVTDTATVAGGFNPSGTVTFALFSDATCATRVFTSANVALAGGSATSTPFTPASPGTFYWTAVYGGDANNNPASSPCGAPNESVLIGKAQPTISTTASGGGPVGSTSVSDTATVAGGLSPTGNVTFRLFADAGCTAPVFSPAAVTLVGGSATSPGFTPTSAGTYNWTAVYNGDSSNDPATSPCGAPNESVTIAKASPTITTLASPGNLLGAAVSDTATVAGGFNPTGTVTFSLFFDSICAHPAFTVSTALSGPTASSGNFTPLGAGTYYWTALYNGDGNNNVATSPCGAPNESVTILPFEPPPFTQVITGDYVGPLTINAGQSVRISSARVVGPVTVNPGGALTVFNSQISRGITANAPSFFSLCGTQVSGPSPAVALAVSNADVPIRVGDPSSSCAGNRFAGQVSLTSNLAVTFGANIVSGSATIDNNGRGSGATVIKANTVIATLGCSGNNPPPTNVGMTNTAGAKTGQCATL